MADEAGEAPLKFSNKPKLRDQMRRRDWTEPQGKRGPATRHVHPITGKSVVVDEASGEIFHVGGEGFRYA